MPKVVRYFLVVGFLALVFSLLHAAEHKPSPPPLLDNGDPGSVHLNIQTGLPNTQKKKACSEAYPMPEAAKRWTECHSGEYSRCGGPDDCVCSDDDDRLIWYHCNEGSFAVCEDDNTCKDSS
jgi:hypothetical protein